MSIIEFLSDRLVISESKVGSYISTCPYRYKKYSIEKRNGRGVRRIAQPAKEVKYLQRMVLDQFLADLPVNDGCMAYKKGVSILDNAMMHATSRYILKMDFRDYFPSIKPLDLINHLDVYQAGRYNEADKRVIERLFFYRPTRRGELVLSVGAPSSPFISNTIMFEFDQLIDSYCRDRSLIYTRYADDLTFSSVEGGVLFDVPNFVKETLVGLRYPRISVNDEKTRHLSKKWGRYVTGLVLSNDGGVSIGRKKKRAVKSRVYKFSRNELPAEDVVSLRGYLSFCLSVDREFVKALGRKYGESVLIELGVGADYL